MSDESRSFVDVDLKGASFRQVELNDARFREVDFGGAVLRDVYLSNVEIDSPEIDGLVVNGVEIAGLVEAELRRRQPARAFRDATTPAELQECWSLLEQSWSAALERAAAMPVGTVDISIDGEWSLALTLRHLLFAIDKWLGAARAGQSAFHPWGIPFAGYDEAVDGSLAEIGVDLSATPSYDEIVEAFNERMHQVRTFLADLTAQQMLSTVQPPQGNGVEPTTVLRCLRVIFNEGCEHLRYAVRDLDKIGS